MADPKVGDMVKITTGSWTGHTGEILIVGNPGDDRFSGRERPTILVQIRQQKGKIRMIKDMHFRPSAIQVLPVALTVVTSPPQPSE